MGSAPGARAVRVISQPVLGAEAGEAAVAALEALIICQDLVQVQKHPAALPSSQDNVRIRMLREMLQCRYMVCDALQAASIAISLK